MLYDFLAVLIPTIIELELACFPDAVPVPRERACFPAFAHIVLCDLLAVLIPTIIELELACFPDQYHHT